MRTMAFGLLLSGLVNAQARGPTISLDPTRPYVQIVFDHVGHRKPLDSEETERGVWLRLKNNCQVPINVDAFDPGTGDPGLALLHEVVKVQRSIVGYGGTADVAVNASPAIPVGYSDRDVASPVVIKPGSKILFSVPSNHISRDWYIRVKFELELPPVRAGRQPYSFVDFSLTDVPLRYQGDLGSGTNRPKQP